MRLATWNINSVRLRLPQVKAFTDKMQPDVICLQETKVQDSDFPANALRDMGYPHILVRGEKSYNGVAILSKIPLEGVERRNVAGSRDTRHISTRLASGIELHNFYIPSGGDEPDITNNAKFKFKLEFVEDMHRWFEKNRKQSDKIIIVGDFNIAPQEHDVWSSKQLQHVISHTEPEITRLNALKNSLGWVDAARHFVPENEKLYSWWSYRNKDWKSSNRGRRLDHIWVTEPLKASLKAHTVFAESRDWDKPSDHVPVVVDFS